MLRLLVSDLLVFKVPILNVHLHTKAGGGRYGLSAMYITHHLQPKFNWNKVKVILHSMTTLKEQFTIFDMNLYGIVILSVVHTH